MREKLGFFFDGESSFGLQNSEPFLTITIGERLQNIYSSSRHSDREAEGTEASL